MNWLIPITSAVAALVGVYVGAYLVDARERKKRRSDFITRQLTEFYGPLVARRAETGYDNASVSDTLLPAYRQMIIIFREKWSLAEPETRRHLPALVKFVEIWEGHLKGTVSGAASEQLAHSEENLKPLFAHLETTHDRLQRALSEDDQKRRWLAWRHVPLNILMQ
jgi:hypothetical protein